MTDTTVVWIRTFWLVNLMERGYLHDEIIVGEGVRLKGNTLPPPHTVYMEFLVLLPNMGTLV